MAVAVAVPVAVPVPVAVAVAVDVDLTCMRVLLPRRTRFADLPPGSGANEITDDPAAALAPPAWCHPAGHHYRGQVTSALGPAHGIQLTAPAAAVDARWPWVRRA